MGMFSGVADHRITLYAEIDDPSHPSGKRRLDLKDILRETGLLDSWTATVEYNLLEEPTGHEFGQGDASDLKHTNRSQRKRKPAGGEKNPGDPKAGKYCRAEGSTQYLPPWRDSEPKPCDPDGRFFMPPPRGSRKEWHCRHLRRFAREAAHPAGEKKITGQPCMHCDGCHRYARDMKIMRYLASNPANLQTVLKFKAPDPNAAKDFRRDDKHSKRRKGTRRLTILHQNYLKLRQDGPRMPAIGFFIWDAALDEATCQAIKDHAEQFGMYDVEVVVMAIDGDDLAELMPNSPTIEGRDGKTIETSRLVRGWVKEFKMPSDCRDGRQHLYEVPHDEEPITETQQTMRAKKIADSWRPEYIRLANPNLTKEQRVEQWQRAGRCLDRARYVDFDDWLEDQTDQALELLRDCIDARLCGEKPPIKTWRRYTNAPQSMVTRVADYLAGKRKAAPALTHAAETLGYISMWGEPHIDPAFLRELTDTLPPLWSTGDNDERYDDEYYQDDLDPPMSDEERLERDIRMAA